MDRRPRPPQESILARGLAWRILRGGTGIGLGTLAVFAGTLAAGADIATARTMAFDTLVFFQLFFVFHCRSEDLNPLAAGLLANRQLVAAVLFCLGLQLSVNYVPPLAAVFHSVPLSPREMALSLAVAASPLEASGLVRLWQVGSGRRTGYLRA